MQEMLALIALALLATHVSAFGAAGMLASPVRARTSGDLNMKIFDWKRRQLFETYEVPSGELRPRREGGSSSENGRLARNFNKTLKLNAF